MGFALRRKSIYITPNQFEESCMIYDTILIEMGRYASDLDGSLFLLKSLDPRK